MATLFTRDVALADVFREVTGRARYIRRAQGREADAIYRSINRYRSGRVAWSWSRPNEEFLADVQLCAKRALSPSDYRLYVMHVVEGLTYRQCLKPLGLDRIGFNVAYNRIVRNVAAEFARSKVWPVSQYFPSRKPVSQFEAEMGKLKAMPGTLTERDRVAGPRAPHHPWLKVPIARGKAA